MNKKYLPLFGLIISIFLMCFISINLRYNKYYRIPGVNNAIIDQFDEYLSNAEQEYLINNVIPTKLFIEYIDVSDFELVNYMYYNTVKSKYPLLDKEELVVKTNIVVKKIMALYPLKVQEQLALLLDTNLFEACATHDDFKVDRANLYSIIASIYPDTSYVTDTELLIVRLREMGITDPSDIVSYFTIIEDNYDLEGIKSITKKSTYNENAKIVFDPLSLDTVVNKDQFIGKFSLAEDKIEIIKYIPRMSYSMYLRIDAYQSLTALCNELKTAFPQECGGLLVTGTYMNYQELDYIYRNNQTTLPGGHNELQLGTSILVSKVNLGHDTSFKDTDLYLWLEKNAYRFGYILRYPLDKVDITKQPYNPSIFRYVGNELAETLYMENKALEEVHIYE